MTDRLFVVQRVYRVNDVLPTDAGPQWIWQFGGLDQRGSHHRHVSQLALPAFDPEKSQASWYRDYAANCGTTEEGQGVLVISQLGKRKPTLRKEFVGTGCMVSNWERGPVRVPS